MSDELVDLTQENELSPSGIRGGKAVLNIGHSRMRAIYFRKIAGEWVPTTPLPADPQSIAMYFARGFRAKPPQEAEKGISCPTCGFEAKSDFGLKAHQRIHKKEEM